MGKATERVSPRLLRSIREAMSYLQRTGKLIAGKTYGSEHILISQDGKNALHTEVSRFFHREYGLPLPCGIDELATHWSNERKGNYRELRDDRPLVKVESYPLFDGGPIEDNWCGIVYLYAGTTAQSRGDHLLKFGYTAQAINKYLKSKEFGHAPILLATRPGDMELEKAVHHSWKQYRVQGREWYSIEPHILDTIKRSPDWDCQQNYQETANMLLEKKLF